MDARHVVTTGLVILAFAAGHLVASDTTAPPPTPAPVSTPGPTRYVPTPTPLPTSCLDAVRTLASMADSDAQVSAGVGRLQVAIDHAERALQAGDYADYNDAMAEVRDVRTVVALAVGDRVSTQPALDHYLDLCNTDTKEK